MKIRILLFSILWVTVCIPVRGQEPQRKPVKRICIHDIYFRAGFVPEPYSNKGTLADFRALAPQSELLKGNLEDNPQNYYFSFYGSGIRNPAIFSGLLGIQFSDKQKTAYKANPLLRIGFSYFSATALTGYFSTTSRKPYDTLTSAQTGQKSFVDSVTIKNYSANYSYKQLRFDASLIFRTDPAARWSLFTGIGINGGVSINANTIIEYYSSAGTETRLAAGSNVISSNFSGGNDRRTENFMNSSNFGMSVYIPMGFDFRIGVKNEFWKRVHLFYELQPGISITSIPELRTINMTDIPNGIGLRVSWN